MEVPGPDTLETWRQSWRVFATAATMLKLATQSTLSKYEMQFERRCERYHYAWHLCVQADNRCRAEYWAAECRRQEAHHQRHPSHSGFRPEMPWDSVIAESAMSTEFWQEELMEPAIAYQRVRGPTPTISIHQQLEPVDVEEAAPHVRRPRGSGKGEKVQEKGALKRSHEPSGEGLQRSLPTGAVPRMRRVPRTRKKVGKLRVWLCSTASKEEAQGRQGLWQMNARKQTRVASRTRQGYSDRAATLYG